MSSESDSFLRWPTAQRPKWASSINNEFQGMQGWHRWAFAFGALWIALSLIPIYHYFHEDGDCTASAPSLMTPSPSSESPVNSIGDKALPNALMLGEDGIQLTKAEYDERRLPDVTDGFKDFRKHKDCDFSTLDLHIPFAPLCTDRISLLEAMSGGGRLGLDAPYVPRGCDMRWFTLEEICSILSRFERIFILGDSLMRNIGIALHVLIRQDLWEGSWMPEKLVGKAPTDCRCFKHGGLHANCKPWQGGVISTTALLESDPDSYKCAHTGTAPIELSKLAHYPLEEEYLKPLRDTVSSTKPKKPYAFVFGTALWNNVNVTASMAWTDQVFQVVEKKGSYLTAKQALYPRLYVSPSGSGPNKPQKFWKDQGDVALFVFEHEMNQRLTPRGIDFLGTLNLTLQASNPDGTHGTFGSNLIKAMMVLNWLNTIDTDSW